MKYSKGYKDYNPMIEEQPGPGKYDTFYALLTVGVVSVMVFILGWW